MRKVPFLLSLMLIFALVLSACSSAGDEGSETNPTPLPGTTEMAPTEATGGLGGLATATLAVPATTEAPAETAAATTEAPATAAATEVVTGTATTEGIVMDLSRLSVLMDQNIQDKDGKDIAEVDNVVVDLCNAKTPYIIAGFGGFLNIGKERVAIPWNAFQISNQDTNGDGTVDHALTLNVTEDQLKNAPDFNPDDINLNAPDWDINLNTVWQNVIEGTGTVTDTTGTTTATPPAETATPAAGSSQQSAANVKLCRVMGSDLLGMDVLSQSEWETKQVGTGVEVTGTPAAGGAVATSTPASATATPAAVAAAQTDNLLSPNEVKEVILNPKTGEVSYLVITVDGVDALKDRWVLVPPKAFTLVDLNPDDDNVSADALVLNVSNEDLLNAPTFEVDKLPDLTVNGWDADLVNFWSGVNFTTPSTVNTNP